MTERIIPLHDTRTRLVRASSQDATAPRDLRGRPLRDLRISVTDRCNFRCTYCMPKEVFDRDYRFLPHAELLSFEEITRVARQFVALGVEKIRLTGGEPLLRKNVENLVGQLAELRTPSGQPLDLTLDHQCIAAGAQGPRTRGRRVAPCHRVARRARRRGVSRDERRRLSGRATCWQASMRPRRQGSAPIKVNMVVKRGVNDREIVPMARHFHGSGHVLRFIEFMDVGTSNGWRMDDVVPSAEVLERIDRVLPLEGIEAAYRGEVAERWRYRDGGGEIGVISSVTQAFCRDCTRARLSTEGKLYLCLFASVGYDLRALLRGPERQPRTTTCCAPRSRRSGATATTTTPKCAALRRPARRKWRCPTSAAEDAPPPNRCVSRSAASC